MIRLGVVGGFPSEEMLDGSYRLDCIGWIISLSVLGLLGEIIFYDMAGIRKLA